MHLVEYRDATDCLAARLHVGVVVVIEQNGRQARYLVARGQWDNSEPFGFLYERGGLAEQFYHARETSDARLGEAIEVDISRAFPSVVIFAIMNPEKRSSP